MRRLNVPLIKQKENLTCGPAALEMVLRFYGKNLSQELIIKKIGGVKKSYGVRTIKLAEFARSLGFNVRCFSYNKKLSKGKAEIKVPSEKEIVDLLKNKIPLILAVNSSILFDKEKFSKKGHFIVLTKYSNKKFWYNDPLNGKERLISEDKLMFALSNNVLNSSAYLISIGLN
jgi:ABC-type bacteriocin/lantibiotic exporter with double-glycine peptidase domain